MSGKNVYSYFKNESGTHVFQRIPPTENKGRRHTSAVNVAVLPLPPDLNNDLLDKKDIEFQAVRGSGPGGQKRNKTSSTIRAIHIPTGASVWIDGRSQYKNKIKAHQILTARIREKENDILCNKYSNNREQQIKKGSKVRTYNFVNNRVTDHATGKKTSDFRGIMNGNLSLFY